MKTLYLTDLDGTLLNKQGRVSAQSAAILSRLMQKGLLFSFATARSIVSSIQVTEGVSWTLPVITSNGVSIQDPVTRDILTRTAFTAEELAPIRQAVQHLCPVSYAYLDGRERVSWLQGAESDGLLAYLQEPARAGDDRLRPVQRPERLFDGEVFCVVCMGRREELAPLYARWQAEGKHQCFLTKQLYNEHWWLEALPLQATKANAARQLKAMLGCDRIVFFGDGANDLSLFQLADEAYATANADEELKKLATAVIGSNDRDGVARWLEAHTGL